MKFGSVCSGIEAASVAFGPLGWEAAWFSEIEPFPCALLAHHYPEVPNLGDMTTIADRIRSGAVEAPDVFVGGTPCQAFPIAGLRNSLDDARGNLSFVFCEIANEIDAARSVCRLEPAIVLQPGAAAAYLPAPKHSVIDPLQLLAGKCDVPVDMPSEVHARLLALREELATAKSRHTEAMAQRMADAAAALRRAEWAALEVST